MGTPRIVEAWFAVKNSKYRVYSVFDFDKKL